MPERERERERMRERGRERRNRKKNERMLREERERAFVPPSVCG